jgi:hypothetical protein
MEMTVAQRRAMALASARLRSQSQPLGVADIASGAVSNLPSSAAKFASDVAQPILHPIETGKALGNVVAGGVEKLIPGEQEHEPYANAVGQFFANRYGGLENFKRTMAEDPVGFLADLSVVMTGGGAAAARMPALAGQVGKAVGTVGRAVDPINAVGKAVKGTGIAASEILGRAGTHTGGESLRTAASAGYAGGAKESAFVDNMRGTAPMQEVVEDSKFALGNIRQQRGKDYRAGMQSVAAIQRPLDFAPIDSAMQNVAGVKNFKGINISSKTDPIRQEILDRVTQWKALDPAQYHTPEGFDALKQSIGEIRDSAPYGTPQRRIADEAYNAVKREIVKQAPEYSKVMKDYQDASELIREMEGTLSLNPKARIDTTLRKLQSVMRNNANTNYGKRIELAELLAKSGAPNLMEKLAGQALNSWMPRGLGAAVAGGGLSLQAVTNGLLSVFDPTVVALLASQSPRVMGEAALAAGKTAKVISKTKPRASGQALYQSGRLQEQVDY